MTAEDTITALRAENARLCADVAVAHARIATLSAQVATLLERVKDLEGQRATTRRTSSKPPSSAGAARLPRSLRGKSGKKPGGQPGHPGAQLRLVDAPDHVIERRPLACPACAGLLMDAPEIGVERRQVVEVAPIRPVVTE